MVPLACYAKKKNKNKSGKVLYTNSKFSVKNFQQFKDTHEAASENIQTAGKTKAN